MTGITENIARICNEAAVALLDLNAVAVSAGPGSYTGLRIGISVAKGICHGLQLPLITISTLEAMVNAVRNQYPEPGTLYCPLIDARRMEVYTLLANGTGRILQQPFTYIVQSPAFEFIPKGTSCVFFGSGLEKCLEFLPDGALTYPNFTHSAKHLHAPAFQQYLNGAFADMAYFEPEYLKDFYTSSKKNNTSS